MSSKPALKSNPQAALLEGRVPEAVVLRAPFGVAQDGVRLADLLEALLGLVIARVLVRVIAQGELPVGLFSSSSLADRETPRTS
jgi:hypothetical protein